MPKVDVIIGRDWTDKLNYNVTKNDVKVENENNEEYLIGDIDERHKEKLQKILDDSNAAKGHIG